jgi:hypothetical protein
LPAIGGADISVVSYMFWRGSDWVLSDTCRNPDGLGFHLVVTQNGVRHIEEFQSVPPMLEREHQWVETWRAHGWREVVETISPLPVAHRADAVRRAEPVPVPPASTHSPAAAAAPRT